MRLICPNCGAQYEVADDVVPEAGRDVQCSNCGHTWFEKPGALASAEEAYGADLTEQDTQTAAPEIKTEEIPEPEAEPEPEEQEAPEDTTVITDLPDEETKTTPEQHKLDPELAKILQEEAARETAARQSEADTGLESQPELGIEDAAHDLEAQRSEEARRRMASMRGEPDPTDSAIAATLAAGGSRRELLPDIEEINSSLTPDEHRPESETYSPPETPQRRKRRGFRLSFVLIVLVAAIAAALYLLAPKIIEMLPASETALTAYVNMVNDGRIWLDTKMQSALEWLTSAAEGS